MAHHQHHGADYDAHMSRSLQSRPTTACSPSMPIISEDEMLAEADEPPDQKQQQFRKHVLPPPNVRRQSLLTRGLHTDSEQSHDDEHYLNKLPSISSTASTHSVLSVGDLTSDDGRISPSTRASTPGSPKSILAAAIPKLQLQRRATDLSLTDSHPDSDNLHSDEATVEAKLGRKRCIMFACGQTNTSAPKADVVVEKKPTEPAKRPCTIKFACPFKANKSAKLEEPTHKVSRHLSPAPLKHTNATGTAFSRRQHRDSDVTVRDVSPNTPRAVTSPIVRPKMRRMSSANDTREAEANRFHEFASESEEREDWTEESTCHRNRLTVNDTLQKEMDIRKLAEEVDEEEALEKEIEDDLDEDEDDDDDVLSEESSEDGFKSDDEDGFAESDEDESDADYEWWAPRHTLGPSPYVGNDNIRPLAGRTYSNSSMEASDDGQSPQRRGRRGGNRSNPVQIRTRTPDLPDSTDFVCGTLDEDRPQEQAYLLAMAQRKAARRKVIPQDIDPSFPIEDPDMVSEDEKKAKRLAKTQTREESDFMHGRPSDHDDEEPRGRRRNDSPPRRISPCESPKRPHSPPPKSIIKKSCAKHRSPAPVALFGGNRPLRRVHTSDQYTRLTSPPPSRRGSTTASPQPPTAFGVAFLSTRGRLTHTASLPRSPHPFFRKRHGSPPPQQQSYDDDEEDEGSATDMPDDSSRSRYSRGAIDIAQGLETKRLKRREKFYRQYCKKEEKKERKAAKKNRPMPGIGAQRMRQIGLECAVYRGKRMLSI